MRKLEFNVIEIEWSKISITEDVFEFNSDEVEIKVPNCLDCLYQAYGDSPIYGRDALLYIGQTNTADRRTLEHVKSDFNRILNFSLYIGQLNPAKQEFENILNITESVLITLLKPSYNSANIKDIRSIAKTEPYLILNKGNRGALPLECSNIWWL